MAEILDINLTTEPWINDFYLDNDLIQEDIRVRDERVAQENDEVEEVRY